MFEGSGPRPGLTEAAGFSVGEFAALVFGRAITFDDGMFVFENKVSNIASHKDKPPLMGTPKD